MTLTYYLLKNIRNKDIRTLGRRHAKDRCERLGVIGQGWTSQKESS